MFLHGKVTSQFFFFENAHLFPNSHQQNNSKTAQTFRNNNTWNTGDKSETGLNYGQGMGEARTFFK